MSLLRKLIWYWAKHSRVEIISGHGEESTPYLVRYHLINNRFFKLYFHKFLRSDLDNFHDHPWKFWTLMIQGAYTEELYDWRTRTFTTLRRSPTENAFVHRGPDALHRVIVDKKLTVDQLDEAPTTLFFAGPKTQEWGFVRDYATAPKWTHWKEYLGIKE